MFRAKRLYIFDFDGVLVDSVHVKTEAFAELYQEYGEEVVEQVVSHHNQNGGMSRYDKFRHYHRHFLGQSIGTEEVDELAAKFSELVVSKVVQSEKIVGADELLEYCKREGIVCAINSATPEEELKYIISQRGWDDYFRFVFGSPTKKAANILRIVEHSGKSIDEGLFFGDAINDFSAAQEVGIDFVAINFAMAAELSSAVPSFDDLSGYLHSLLEH